MVKVGYSLGNTSCVQPPTLSFKILRKLDQSDYVLVSTTYNQVKPPVLKDLRKSSPILIFFFFTEGSENHAKR